MTLKCFDQNQMAELIQLASASERKRLNYNFHPTLDDPVNRFFNAMLPGTYVRPHRHSGDKRWEFFVIVSGEAVVVCFDDNGALTERHLLNPTTANIAIEIPPNTWHSLAITQTETVLFESKPGPYQVTSDKDFAQWAPLETDKSKQIFIDWYLHGEIGSLPPKPA